MTRGPDDELLEHKKRKCRDAMQALSTITKPDDINLMEEENMDKENEEIHF